MKPGTLVLSMVQELLRRSDMSITMIYSHVRKVAAEGRVSPPDALGFGA